MSDNLPITSISIILNRIVAHLLEDNNLGKVITILLDISGSTGDKFGSGTILDMEISIAKDIAKKNKDGTTLLVAFHTIAEPLGEIRISQSGTVMLHPGIKPMDNTNTHTGFRYVLDTLQSTKTEKLCLITDGQLTDRSRNATTLCSYADQLRHKGVEITVVAVSAKEIHEQNEKNLASMDVLEIINSSSEVFTPLHSDIPVKIATTSNTSPSFWNLLGSSIPKNPENPLPTIIMMIINGLLDEDINFLNQDIQQELQTLFIEMGMLVGLLNMTGSNCIAAFGETLIMLEAKTGAELSEFIQYGIQLKRSNEPFVLVNLQRRLVDYREQRATYQDATNNLKSNGTALDGPGISFTNGLVCIRVDVSSLGKKDIYSTDSAGNIVFASEGDKQAIRQGLRSFFGDYGRFRDSRNSPSVVFGVSNIILLYLLVAPDLTLDNEYIEKLRRLARIQIGQKIQNRDKSYGNSYEEEFNDGNLPQIYFSRQGTHADLYTDSQINPLGLPQTLWWAVMMMIFGNGLFKAQMRFYKDVLNAEGIDPTEESLIEYLRRQYSSKVTGTVKFLTVDRKQSIITLSDFPEGSTIYKNLQHTSPRGQECNTETHYSKEELGQLEHKCVWCHQQLSLEQFKRVQSFTADDLRNPNPARFISQVQTSRESAQVPSGGGSTVFSSRLHSNVSSTSTKRKIQIHVNFGKGKLQYDSYANAVKSAISSDSINANIMEQDVRQREKFLRSAVQQFQCPPANRTLSYVGGESDLVTKGDSYYFWGKILVGKIADIEVEYIRY